MIESLHSIQAQPPPITSSNKQTTSQLSSVIFNGLLAWAEWPLGEPGSFLVGQRLKSTGLLTALHGGVLFTTSPLRKTPSKLHMFLNSTNYC